MILHPERTALHDHQDVVADPTCADHVRQAVDQHRIGAPGNR